MVTHYRRVVKIAATDSPNVIHRRELIPGVITWEEYQHRLATWDDVRQCIGLRGEFYEGADLLLYPPDWLDVSEHNFNGLMSASRKAEGLGCDPGEGGANTSWTAVDELGVVEVRSEKTKDTTEVVEVSIEMMERHNVPPDRFCMDTGGGGKQHADTLRSRGYPIRLVAFSSAVSLSLRRGLRLLEERRNVAELAYAYTNRRVQMYHELSQLIDPAQAAASGRPVFAVPPGITTGMPCHQHGRYCLRNQLAVFPKMKDREDRYKLPPKNKPTPDSKEKCLTDMIGHSPDEADSLVLGAHAMLHVERRPTAGVF